MPWERAGVTATLDEGVLPLDAGKIRRESAYWDAATFMQQVGLLPSPWASRTLFADTNLAGGSRPGVSQSHRRQ